MTQNIDQPKQVATQMGFPSYMPETVTRETQPVAITTFIYDDEFAAIVIADLENILNWGLGYQSHHLTEDGYSVNSQVVGKRRGGRSCYREVK